MSDEGDIPPGPIEALLTDHLTVEEKAASPGGRGDDAHDAGGRYNRGCFNGGDAMMLIAPYLETAHV